MNEESIIEAPGFRARITSKFGNMLVIDANVEADISAHAGETEDYVIIVSRRFEMVMSGTTRACLPDDHLVVDACIDYAIRVIEPGRLVLIGKM